MEKISELSADLVLVNGKVVTIDSEDSIVEAIAVKNGLITATGTTKEIMRLVGPKTRVVDLKGKTVLPGFIDSHTHPPSAGTRIFTVDCHDLSVKSIKDIQRMVQQRAEKIPQDKWIRVSNYNDLKLMEKRHITRWELDEAAPLHPVFITTDTGHLHIANSKALELAGITKDTPDPAGGKIDKAPDGTPTGLLYETAGGLVSRLMPAYTLEETKEGLKSVFKQFLEWGVTTTHDAGAGAMSIKAYQELLEAGEMPIRVLLMVRGPGLIDHLIGLGIQSGFGGDKLKVMSIKIMGDGSGAGGTAAVYEPQHRGTKDLGFMVTPSEDMRKIIVKAHEAGLRVSVHAIGDRAIDAALDGIEESQRRKPVPDMRHRLEHCSLCPPKQMDRIKKLGVTPSVSIGYMWGIGDNYAENFGPEREQWLHPLRSMKERGIIAGGNSDYAVSDGNPLIQIYAAVTRKTMTGRVVGAEEAISVMDAIRLYTWNGAYLGKEEDVKGSLEPGKFADMAVLDRDILTTPPEEIKNIKVIMTIIGGEILYEKQPPLL
jgi:hypothetical protein